MRPAPIPHLPQYWESPTPQNDPLSGVASPRKAATFSSLAQIVVFVFTHFFRAFQDLSLSAHCLHSTSPEQLITVILEPWLKAPKSRSRLGVLRLVRARSRRWTSLTKRMPLDTESISKPWTWRPLIKRFADNTISNCLVLPSDNV